MHCEEEEIQAIPIVKVKIKHQDKVEEAELMVEEITTTNTSDTKCKTPSTINE